MGSVFHQIPTFHAKGQGGTRLIIKEMHSRDKTILIVLATCTVVYVIGYYSSLFHYFFYPSAIVPTLFEYCIVNTCGECIQIAKVFSSDDHMSKGHRSNSHCTMVKANGQAKKLFSQISQKKLCE